ncbi:MAG TPA: FAD/NAD(P)-binding protein [Ktedonobacterales bacterium]
MAYAYAGKSGIGRGSDAERETRRTLLVLGAGPKGLAIAAKQAALNSLGFAVPRVVLVDKTGVGADWSGKHGFTDGRRVLGTSPEKDVGFPYDSTCWGDATLNKVVDQAMTAYSWQTHLIEEYKYSEWVDRGRPRPLHRQWSAYLRWVAEKSQAEVVRTEVVSIGLTEDGRRWRLQCRVALPAEEVQGRERDSQDEMIEGDGLVLTGPGTPIRLAGQPTGDPRVLDGGNVWQALDYFMRLRPALTMPLHIGIVGTGETAAATVMALLETLGDRANIEILSSRGVIYSRDEGFEENQLFSNPDPHRSTALGKRHPSVPGADEDLIHTHAVRWLSLTEEDRREFVRRADRGVFSVQAVQELTQAWNVRSVTGNAVRIRAMENGIVVESTYGGTTRQMQYDYVVVARGFDALWFLSLLDDGTRARLAELAGPLTVSAFERAIGSDLGLEGVEPRLHLPMLAGVAQGPGFPNLSCLGLLSDRILMGYTELPQ